VCQAANQVSFLYTKRHKWQPYSICNSAEEQHHKQDDIKFFILQKHNSILVPQYRTFLSLFDELLVLSQNEQLDAGIKIIEQWCVPACISDRIVLTVTPDSVSFTL